MTASQRVCVTGGTGYTGRRLVQRLVAQGCDVHVLARRPEAVPGGATAYRWPADVASLMGAIQPSVVIHLVAHYIRRATPEQLPILEQVQVELGGAVVAGALEAGARRLVVASSSHAYGAGGEPVNAYGASRRRFEAGAELAAGAAGVPLARLLVHDVYGPDDPRRKLVPALLKAARTGEPAPLVADGEPLDLVFVDDVVAAFTLAALGPAQHGAFAVRTNEVTTAPEVRARIEAILGRSVPTVPWPGSPLARPLELPWDGPDLPGWAPTVPLTEGLTRLLG